MQDSTMLRAAGETQNCQLCKMSDLYSTSSELTMFLRSEILRVRCHARARANGASG